MPLIDADITLEQIRGNRRVWLPGANSSGKSAMSFMLAHEMALRWGYKIVSNTECVWNEKEEPQFDDEMQLHVVFIADEGAEFFQSDVDVHQITKYAGKMDIILMCPSVEEPAPAMQLVTVQRMAGFRSIGVPLDNWETRINCEKKKERFKFSWVGMEEIYGVYSTLHPAYSAEGIRYWIRKKVQEYKDFYLSKRFQAVDWLEPYAIEAEAEREETRKYSSRKRGSEVGTFGRETLILTDQVRKIKGIADNIEAVSEREEEGRRRGKGLIGRIL
jgi:hypothetical protein